MKKLLQLAAWVVVALIAGQPMFAAMNCAQGYGSDGECAPVCCAAESHGSMAQMGMDCHSALSSTAADNGCGQNACSVTTAQMVAKLATPEKSRHDSTPQSTPVVPFSIQLTRASTAQPLDISVAGAPARYILLQVFRI